MATNRLDCLPLCNDISIMLPERCVVLCVVLCWFCLVGLCFSTVFPEPGMALAANAGRFIGVVFSLLFWVWI